MNTIEATKISLNLMANMANKYTHNTFNLKSDFFKTTDEWLQKTINYYVQQMFEKENWQSTVRLEFKDEEMKQKLNSSYLHYDNDGVTLATKIILDNNGVPVRHIHKG
ncbi:MAG: hypothetical protein N4Q30_07415 [Neisseriaceae bacterium]|nr:hypothetical protein [Neisseriaceae bacterium]